MKFNEWLEKNFVEWMAQAGKVRTQADFAEWLGIHKTQLNMYLTGNRTPTGENVDKLAAKLGPEIYDLLGLARPDPLLQYVTHNWHKLPEETQNQIREQVETYLANGQQQPKPQPR